LFDLFQDSPIIDFYPEDFKIDLNGKKFAWQGVALLPFVEEKRLFKALEPYYDALTPAESKYEFIWYQKEHTAVALLTIHISSYTCSELKYVLSFHYFVLYVLWPQKRRKFVFLVISLLN